jgi:hypothetical protein
MMSGAVVAQMGVELRVIRVGGNVVRTFGVVDLCVRQSERSRGLGSRLLAEVSEFARACGMDFVILFADDGRLYARNGWAAVPNRCSWLKIHEYTTLGLAPAADTGAMMVKAVGSERGKPGVRRRAPYQPADRGPAPGRAGQPHAAVPAALTTPTAPGSVPPAARRTRQHHHHRPNGATMTAWTSEDLARIGGADELEIAPLRGDGTLGSPRTIWVVPHGDSLYARSVNGPTSAWYRGTQARHQGHVRAGGVDKDVTFLDADHELNDELDAAYRDKYRRYSTQTLDRITSPAARSTTIELIPR